MEEKLSGIVVGGVNYGESDKILNIFTLEKGMVSAKIKGVKKAGAKLKFASEPFCFAEYVFSKSGDRCSSWSCYLWLRSCRCSDYRS